jgi:hypothetical protein
MMKLRPTVVFYTNPTILFRKMIKNYSDDLQSQNKSIKSRFTNKTKYKNSNLSKNQSVKTKRKNKVQRKDQ